MPLALVGLLVLACVFPATGAAVPGDITRLPGAAACVSDDGSGGECEDGIVGQLQGVAVAPDGLNVYAAGAFGPGALLAFSRNTTTGELDQLAPTAGCYAPVGPPPDCVDVEGISQPRDVTMSPDGRHVYVAGDGTASVVAFVRNPDGSLTRVSELAGGCFTAAVSPGCMAAPEMGGGAYDLVVSPDGANLYVISSDSDPAKTGILVFDRNATTGGLSLPPNPSRCITENGDGATCADGHALNSPDRLAISRDGRSLYVGAQSGDGHGALAILRRDLLTGDLSQSAGTDGCFSDDGSGGCQALAELGRTRPTPTVAPGDAFVYIASQTGGGPITPTLRGGPEGTTGAIRGFSRAANGDLTPLSTGGCLVDSTSTAPPAGCVPAIAIGRPLGIQAVGEGLYYSGYGDGLVGALPRSSTTGTIGAVTPPGGCAAAGGAYGCAPLVVGLSSYDLELSPEGRSLYVTSFGGTETTEKAIAAFSVEPFLAPSPPPEPTPTQDLPKCRGKTATFAGTSGRDVLKGTSARDVFATFEGNDVVRGLGGNDLICTGTGRDRVRAGGGRDKVFGEAGNDRLRGGRGSDGLNGGKGKDRLAGEAGNDRLGGGAGNDRLSGGRGRDRLRGGAGRKDRCNGGRGADGASACERRSAI